jgi:hypothetical protein
MGSPYSAAFKRATGMHFCKYCRQDKPLASFTKSDPHRCAGCRVNRKPPTPVED